MNAVLQFLRFQGPNSNKWYAILEVPGKGALCAWGRWPEAGRSKQVDERKAAAKCSEKADRGYTRSSDRLPAPIHQAIEKDAEAWLSQDVDVNPISHRVKVTPRPEANHDAHRSSHSHHILEQRAADGGVV